MGIEPGIADNPEPRDDEVRVEDYPEPTRPVTESDLWGAIEWLGTYEAVPSEDENVESLAAVRAWLIREADRRTLDKSARDVAAQAAKAKGIKVTPALVRKARALIVEARGGQS
jgi:hypothetical protein